MKTTLSTVAVVLAIAGCGANAQGVSDRDRVENTIERYYQATARGDGASACRLLTDQARHGFQALLDVPPARDCEANVRKVARRNVPLKDINITQLVMDDDRASAYVTAERPRYGKTVVLTRDGESWRFLYLPTAIAKYQLPRIAAPDHSHHARRW